ncbi:hypothetical protein F2Q69_00045093 [Brassica cretica]|uniref:Uncharacterized protein n=1 Tax=Brassica cretica TaxID=69181 RepID=A0A8S9NK09_BRACR|nr:hypothetical protein F2Q69_00045093 [Brassica cretica]
MARIHSTRLGLALNFSVFYYDAFEEAIAELDTLGKESLQRLLSRYAAARGSWEGLGSVSSPLVQVGNIHSTVFRIPKILDCYHKSAYPYARFEAFEEAIAELDTLGKESLQRWLSRYAAAPGSWEGLGSGMEHVSTTRFQSQNDLNLVSRMKKLLNCL